MMNPQALRPQRISVDKAAKFWHADSMTKTEAWSITGGLSTPSKMPCYSFSLPAWACNVGSSMHSVFDSICSKCYARKGNYLFANVQEAFQRRMRGLSHPQWVEAMAFLINYLESSGYFRWFDSGDVQGDEHLAKIIEVCKQTPNISHWLPTREYGVIARFLDKGGVFPANLTVRVSTLFFDTSPSVVLTERFKLPTGGVSTLGKATCPAHEQGNKCLLCRKCWDKQVSHVIYRAH